MKKIKEKKVVIITGASSGIGLETANYLSSFGYTVYGISNKEFSSDKFEHLLCDVCNQDEMKKVFEYVYQKEKQIDVLINNAGIGISGAIEYIKQEDLNKIFDINIKAVIMCTSLALPYLRQTKGKIINTSSVASVFAIPFQACYSATKSAIEMFSLALCNEVKSQGIKVTCIRPGDTKTGFTSARIKTEVENDVYGKKITKSVQKMEKDEQNGASPLKVAKVMHKVIKKKNPPYVVTVDGVYKFLIFLKRLLPLRFVNYIVGKMY